MIQNDNPKSMLFLGVSIIEDGGSGITMELEMNWDGNPSIILDIKTRLGVSLPVQVKKIRISLYQPFKGNLVENVESLSLILTSCPYLCC